MTFQVLEDEHDRKIQDHCFGKVYEVEVERISGDTGNVSRSPVAETQRIATPPPVQPKPVTQKSTPAPAASGSQAELTAPIPGKVFKIIAKPGDAVKTGDLILIIEAMKMENEITAECDGTIAAIPVNEGDNVAAGDVLVRF